MRTSRFRTSSGLMPTAWYSTSAVVRLIRHQTLLNFPRSMAKTRMASLLYAERMAAPDSLDRFVLRMGHDPVIASRVRSWPA